MRAVAYVSTAPKADQFVYYLCDADGTPIYIGRSADVTRRIRQHNCHATRSDNPNFNDKWRWFFDVRSVSMFGPMPHANALAFERHQIEMAQPRGNIKLTRRDRWSLKNRATA
jgi:excinuclease UvrABC nuclease subunit